MPASTEKLKCKKIHTCVSQFARTKALIQYKADLSIRNHSGKTPRDMAHDISLTTVLPELPKTFIPPVSSSRMPAPGAILAVPRPLSKVGEYRISVEAAGNSSNRSGNSNSDSDSDSETSSSTESDTPEPVRFLEQPILSSSNKQPRKNTSSVSETRRSSPSNKSKQCKNPEKAPLTGNTDENSCNSTFPEKSSFEVTDDNSMPRPPPVSRRVLMRVPGVCGSAQGWWRGHARHALLVTGLTIVGLFALLGLLLGPAGFSPFSHNHIGIICYWHVLTVSVTSGSTANSSNNGTTTLAYYIRLLAICTISPLVMVLFYFYAKKRSLIILGFAVLLTAVDLFQLIQFFLELD